jgi:thiol-disulfide isomerase/thioredoxin
LAFVLVLSLDKRGDRPVPFVLRRTLLAAAAGTLAAPQGGRKARAEEVEGLRKLVEVNPPRPAPPITFNDAEGTARRLADFAGKGLVVNFWATWCAPCVAEMPALDRLQAAVAGEGILVLALSSDRGGRAQVEPFYGRVGIRHLGLWLDPRMAAGRSLGVRGLPTTMIVDRAGNERGRLEGPAAWDHPDWIATVRRLTAPPGAATRST